MPQLSGTTFLEVDVAPAESGEWVQPLSAAKTGCSVTSTPSATNASTVTSIKAATNR
ncbi:hypothetical protein [Ktedonobacter robiniae]|uniref:hypothetical protein n=1 Tax=Ktedonobacter robiniae TaxID=2778365 RepID=UPI001915DFCC|nr:hypothetical protein [Ktedonobacter robiniae]